MGTKKKVLYFGSSARLGLLHHLAIASKYFSKIEELDFTLISGNQEQFSGSFKIIQTNNVNYVTFQGIDEIKNIFINIIPFLKYVKREKYNIIHVQTNTQLVLGMLAKILLKIKLIYTMHSHRHGKFIKSFFMSAFLSFVLNLFADKIITLSTLEKKYFRTFLLNTEFLTLGLENNIQRNRINRDSIKIIYPAAFIRRKNHFFLIESLTPLMKKYNDIEVCLPGDGKLLNYFKNKIKKYGLEDRFIFPGWIDREKLSSYMSEANLAVIPSKSETFGFCIVEPLFYGIPVISTPVGIAPDIVKNNYNGFIVKFGNKDMLQEKILYFYENRNKLREFGEKSYEFAINNLTWKIIARKYEELLHRVLPF